EDKKNLDRGGIEFMEASSVRHGQNVQKSKAKHARVFTPVLVEELQAGQLQGFMLAYEGCSQNTNTPIDSSCFAINNDIKLPRTNSSERWRADHHQSSTHAVLGKL